MHLGSPISAGTPGHIAYTSPVHALDATGLTCHGLASERELSLAASAVDWPEQVNSCKVVALAAQFRGLQAFRALKLSLQSE